MPLGRGGLRATMAAGFGGALAFLAGCVCDMEPRVPSADSIVLAEEAVIAATPARVWATLVDLPRYGEWNPWLLKAEGKLSPGEVVWAEVLLGEERMHAKHVVLAVEPTTRLCWRDAGWTTTFVYGQRCRFLRALPEGGVLFRQELLLEGAFRDTALRRYGAALRAGMAAETRALKERAEAAESVAGARPGGL